MAATQEIKVYELSFDEAEELGFDGTLRTGPHAGRPAVAVEVDGVRVAVGVLVEARLELHNVDRV